MGDGIINSRYFIGIVLRREILNAYFRGEMPGEKDMNDKTLPPLPYKLVFSVAKGEVRVTICAHNVSFAPFSWICLITFIKRSIPKV